MPNDHLDGAVDFYFLQPPAVVCSAVLAVSQTGDVHEVGLVMVDVVNLANYHRTT